MPNYVTWLLIVTQNIIISALHFSGFSLNPPLCNVLRPMFRTANSVCPWGTNTCEENPHCQGKQVWSHIASSFCSRRWLALAPWWLLLHSLFTAINPAMILYELRKEVPLFCKTLMIVYHNYTYLSLWNSSNVLNTNFIQFISHCILGAQLGFF